MEDLIDISNHVYDLSPLDIIPSHLYITNVFFYENKSPGPGPFMQSSLLKESLYRALQNFPILLGHVRRHGRNAMQIVVDRDNLNLPLYQEQTHAHLHFRHLKDNGFHRDVWPKDANVVDPRASPNGELIQVHVHRLAEESGVVMVVRIAHCAVDAKGFVDFVQSWGWFTRNHSHPEGESRPRLLTDRRVMYEYLPADVRPAPPRSMWHPASWLLGLLSTLLVLFLGLYKRFLGDKTPPDEIESHLFSVPRHTLDRLRDTATRIDPSSRVSDHDIITALFTLAFAHTKHLLTRRTQTVKAIVPCDFRHRIGVPSNYTGSCAIGLYVSIPGSFLQTPLTAESVARAALLSRAVVATANRATVQTFIRRALRAITFVGDKANVLYAMMVSQAFSNQSRLGFYEVDFGAGGPVMVAPMAYSNTVAVICPAPGPGGDGVGVRVFLTLRPGVMRVLLAKGFLDEFTEMVY
ncbi:acyltransferase helD2 [Aspergillus udagawae]|uniref:Acyltransferase helD2 n=1 Tax=Aspergillus udagawae TaxID=91492 RepID=A0A8E0R232_9EURO|nr:acyltransferase helD2 [Aspergillus udagawae]GIC94635.1 acyltransferase helD2 [Aspergillus udagawae]